MGDEQAYIQATNGPLTMVDWEDFDELDQYEWYYGRGYFYRKTRVKGEQKIIYMHRHILGLGYGDPLQSDHINRDRLDNRRGNLRKATQSQNQANSRMRKDNTSGYRGVQVYRKRFRAFIKVMGNTCHIGYFDTIEQAAEAYNQRAREVHGAFAYQNRITA